MNGKTINVVIGGLFFLILGVIIGFLFGTFLGGNYFANFEFWGLRGYEAVGWIGIITGGALGAIVGIGLGLLVSNKQQLK